MKKFVVVLLLISLASHIALAQKEYRFIRKGNKNFEKEKYNDAEILYRKALEKDQSSVPARFNLGNALYREKNFQEAASAWSSLSNRIDLKPEQQAAIWHNTGNAFLQSQNYQAAIQSYKQALKLNPADEDTRYNLSYALLKARQQQQQKQNQQQNQKQNQRQQNQSNQQAQGQQQNEQPQQAQPQELSKQDAERMLEAMKNAEQKTMEKLKQEKKPMVTGRPIKDW